MKKIIFSLVFALNVLMLHGQQAFRHVTSSTNTSGHITTLDHTQLNGNPDAVVFIMPNYNTNGSDPAGADYQQNAGVWYNGSRWTIFNQNTKAPMPINLTFNVLIAPSRNANYFTISCTAESKTGLAPNAMVIDHPATNNKPYALLLVTQNWAGTYNDNSPIVSYSNGKWYISNNKYLLTPEISAKTTLPIGARFNVMVIENNTVSGFPNARAFVHTATAENIIPSGSSITFFDQSFLNNNTSAMIWATPNWGWSPGRIAGQTSGPYNDSPIKAWYDHPTDPWNYKNGYWSIYNSDGTTLKPGAKFNVLTMNIGGDIPTPTRDLTGFYRGDNGSCGQAYIRQIGNNVYWFGEHPDGSFGHVFSGTISGNTLTGNLWDVPKGTLMNKGNCTYKISADGNTLTRAGGTLGCNVLAKTTMPSSLPASKPMQPGSGALTGVWDCNDGAVTYAREDGNDFIFFSEAKNNGTRPGFANLYIGKRNGNTITGDWVDVPKGTHLGSGKMTLRVESDTRIVRTDSGNGYGGGVWTRISDNFPGTTKISIKSPLTNKIQKISVKERNGLYIYQGDIIVGKKNAPNDAFTNNNDRRWNNGVIPYSIEPNHPNIAAIQAGINMVNNSTNLCLIPRTEDRDFVYFKNGNVCESWIGRIGGSQDITVGLGCDAGRVAHEILHAAGFFHEQSRADRDAFVSIIWESILPDARDNFEREGDARSAFPYDFVSIMHYGPNDFSINGTPTIVARVNSPDVNRMGQRNSLSNGDIRAVNFYYPHDAGCSSAGNTTTFTPADLGPFCPTALLEGDREFSGHGPTIVASVNIQISADRLGLEAVINFRARETTHNWSTTEGRWIRTIYTAPPGQRIMAINSATQSSCDFISGAASAQFGFPGGGNTIYRPPLSGSLARVFEIVGDTGGDDISSDNDCGDDTRITVRFNPISLTLGSR